MHTPFTRRRFLSSIAGCGFALGARVRGEPAPYWDPAPTQTAPLQITVDRGAWGKTSAEDIAAVLQSAGQQIWNHCPHTQLDAIHVYHRTDNPVTDSLRDFHGRISIGLASQDARWAQFSFQFGHEFCHALTQHSGIGKRGWHNLRHANMWFEESLCETGSLFTLRRMSEIWKANAPHPIWRKYAPALASYASVRLALPQHKLPPGVTFQAWFHDSEPALRGNPVLREKNTIVASQLLPLFEAEPSTWEALCYLNVGTRDAKKPFARHLAEWKQNLPPDLKPAVTKIAEVFGLVA